MNIIMSTPSAASFRKFSKRMKEKAPLSKVAKHEVVKIAKRISEKGVPGYIINVQATSGNQTVTNPANYTALLNAASTSATNIDQTVTMSAVSGNYSTNGPLPRSGDILKFTRIHLRGFLSGVNTSTPYDDYVRLVLYVDKQSKAAQPNVNQVVDSQDGVVSSYNNANVDFKKRFRVLYDKTIHYTQKSTVAYASGTLVGNASNTTLAPVQFWEIKKKLNFLADYSRGNAGTYADLDGGQLCLGLITSNQNTYQYGLRYTFNIEYELHNERKEKI